LVINNNNKKCIFSYSKQRKEKQAKFNGLIGSATNIKAKDRITGAAKTAFRKSRSS
jgi:hypothetical protein